jgi:hypothetical protein
MAKRFLTPINMPSRTTDPATASDGDLYFNTSLNVIKVYYDLAWNAISSESIIISDTPPESSTDGQLWYESDSGDLFIRYDGAWVQTGGGGGGGGGSSVLYQDDAPLSPAIGDIWVDANEAIVAVNSNQFILRSGDSFLGLISGITPTEPENLTTKSYVDGFMPKSGGTFSGAVSGITPTLSAHLATKNYVDNTIPPPVDTGLNPFFLGGM